MKAYGIIAFDSNNKICDIYNTLYVDIGDIRRKLREVSKNEDNDNIHWTYDEFEID